MRIVLASASDRRRDLLAFLLNSFEVSPSGIDEELLPYHRDAALFARRLAHAKAAHVALRIPDAVVIGADTLVVLGRRTLGKPAHADEAIEMLQALSGKSHRAITGIAVVTPTVTVRTAATTLVTFRKLGNQEIADYVDSREPFDKAGAYAIQGGAAGFVARLDGCYNNVVGLPVYLLDRVLRSVGVETSYVEGESGPNGERRGGWLPKGGRL